VQVRRRIEKRVRRVAEAVEMAADVNADVAINVRERRPAPAVRRTRTSGRAATEQGKERQ